MIKKSGWIVAVSLVLLGAGYTVPLLTGPSGPVKSITCTAGCSQTGNNIDVNASGGPGATPGGANGNLQTNNGAGGFGAYGGASCAYAVKSLDASGGATCTAAPTIPADISGLQYVTFGTEANLSNERVLTAGTNVTLDVSVAGQIKVNAAGGTGAPTTSQYWLGAADASLASAKNLSTFTGLVLNTAGTPSVYGGASCTNQFPRSLSASGAPTCATVGVADVAAGVTTPDATKYWRGDGTWQTPTAAAAPGGSAGQIQFNNAGSSIGGMSGVNTDGVDFHLVARTSDPTTPGANEAVFFAEQQAANGVSMPRYYDGTLGFDLGFRPWSGGGDSQWGCYHVTAFSGTAAPVVVGFMPMGATNTTGTATAITWNAGAVATRLPGVAYNAASAATNTSFGIRENALSMWRGNAAGAGGFLWTGTWTMRVAAAGNRVFAGVKPAAVLSATADVSTSTNAINAAGFVCDAADTSYKFCSNDGTATAWTCSTAFGASFPCKTANAVYTGMIWSAPNGTAIGYSMSRLDSPATIAGTATTDLPANTVQLGWDVWGNTGTATTGTIGYYGSCVFMNP